MMTGPQARENLRKLDAALENAIRRCRAYQAVIETQRSMLGEYPDYKVADDPFIASMGIGADLKEAAGIALALLRE